MSSSIRNALCALLVVALLCGVGWNMRAAEQGGAAAAGGARYTVVTTDGSHLVVTDNQANKLYFYAIGPDDKVGDPLKLRGTVDLGGVGQTVLKPTTFKD